MVDVRSQTSFFYLLFWWHLCLSAVPSTGALVKQERGGQCGTNAPLAPGQRTPPSLSPPLSSALPPAFIGCASKWRSAYEKGSLFIPRKLAYRLPDSLHKKHSHICAMSVKEGSRLQGFPVFSQLFLLLSCFAMPFSCLNYSEERRRWRWRSLININTD